MGSRRKTGGAVARLPELSRRAVLAGASTTPVLAGASATPVLAGQADAAKVDPTIAACEKWLDVEAERKRLTRAWGRCEELLFNKCNRQNLSAARQSNMPEARKLDEVDAQLKALDLESDVLLKALPTRQATSAAAVIANLSVAAALIYPDDYPEAHDLILRSVRDLKALSSPT